MALLSPLIARLRQPPTAFEEDERFVPVSELGSVEGEATLSAIVMTAYVEGAPATSRRLQPGEALAELMNHVLSVELARVSTFRLLEHVVRRVPCWEWRYPDVTTLENLPLYYNLR